MTALLLSSCAAPSSDDATRIRRRRGETSLCEAPPPAPASVSLPGASFPEVALRPRDYALEKPAKVRGTAAGGPAAKVVRRTTPIGRFSHLTETAQNVSVPVAFVVLADPVAEPGATVLPEDIGPRSLLGSGADPLSLRRRQRPLLFDGGGMTAPELHALFGARGIYDRHWRMRSRLKHVAEEGGRGRDSGEKKQQEQEEVKEATERRKWDEKNFEVSADPDSQRIVDTLHPSNYRTDLCRIVESALSRPVDTAQGLWEATVSSGPLGSSGAMSKDQLVEVLGGAEGGTESVAIMRFHHVMCDGVSFGNILLELCDEAELIQEMIAKEIAKWKAKRSSKKMSFLARLLRRIRRAIFFLCASIAALLRHAFLVATTSNPFNHVLEDSSLPPGLRSVSWANSFTSVTEAKEVAKALCPGATLNDLFVSCVSAAVTKQLQWHDKQKQIESVTDKGYDAPPPSPQKFNIVVPVHLTGGILPHGSEIGNRIGAFVACVPRDVPSGDDGAPSSTKRLSSVRSSLAAVKTSPAPFVGHVLCRLLADYAPAPLASAVMARANAGAVAVVSNVRSSSPERVHWNGRVVASTVGFLPLPPGVPIGATVTSYAGNVTISLNADKRAVPDPDLFMRWVLEEYCILREEAQNQSKSRKLV